MDEEESIKLLQARPKGYDNIASGVTTSQLAMLSSRLEYLALALMQAVAIIRTNSISVEAYLRLLGESD